MGSTGRILHAGIRCGAFATPKPPFTIQRFYIHVFSTNPGVEFSWGIPKVLSPNHKQSLSEVPRTDKAHSCSWRQTGSTVILPAIPSTLDSQWQLQDKGLVHSVPLPMKAPQDMAKHAAKHPPFGEEQAGTCRNTPAISASLPQTVPWLHPSPRALTSGSTSWGNVRCSASKGLYRERGNKGALFGSTRL